MTSPSDRLLARLRAMGVELPPDATVERTYAGPAQRASGAWSWYVWSDSAPLRVAVGSHAPVTQLLRERRLVASRPATGGGYASPDDISVDPWQEQPAGYQTWIEEPLVPSVVPMPH